MNSRWALSPDAQQGLPFMILEALRLQRQHLLAQKLPLKPFSLSLLCPKEDTATPKAVLALQDLNTHSHTAKIAYRCLDWQEHLKQLQLQLQQQPAAERNLLLLDPVGLSLPSLQELVTLLPKKLDLLLLLPLSALHLAGGGVSGKNPIPAEIQQLGERLPGLPQVAGEEPAPPSLLLAHVKQQLRESSKRFVMQVQQVEESLPLLLLGLTTDALMMEKMLLASQCLEVQKAQQLQFGAQLGLFKTTELPDGMPNAASIAALEQLFSQQAEWDNQALYKAILEQEIPVQEATTAVQELLKAGAIEVLNEKKKKLVDSSALSLTNTAFKLPAPSRFFRRKN